MICIVYSWAHNPLVSNVPSLPEYTETGSGILATVRVGVHRLFSLSLPYLGVFPCVVIHLPLAGF